jgi:hypothetical protein
MEHSWQAIAEQWGVLSQDEFLDYLEYEVCTDEFDENLSDYVENVSDAIGALMEYVQEKFIENNVGK